MLLDRVPVNPADNVPGHLNTTKYTDPFTGVVIKTIPVPYSFVEILGFVHMFIAEL